MLAMSADAHNQTRAACPKELDKCMCSLSIYEHMAVTNVCILTHERGHNVEHGECHIVLHCFCHPTLTLQCDLEGNTRMGMTRKFVFHSLTWPLARSQ